MGICKAKFSCTFEIEEKGNPAEYRNKKSELTKISCQKGDKELGDKEVAQEQ